MTNEDSSAPNRRRSMGRAVLRAPGWLRVALALACIALGAALLTRPLLSLGTLVVLIGATLIVSGIADLVTASRADSAAAARFVVAAAWIIAGVVVIAWPGVTVRVLAIVVGVMLAISGVRHLIGAVRGGPVDARIADVLLGLAGIVVGALALAWPDVTVLVVAVLFGARTIWFGLTTLWGVTTRRHDDAGEDTSRTGQRGGFLRRSSRLVAAAVALLLALGLGSVSASLNEGSPTVDDFYAAPADVPSAPGQLLRSEPFTRAVPADAVAWRILYTTTRATGAPAVASGIVVAPKQGTNHPVIAWAHGTTGYATQCAPSLLAKPFEAGALFTLDKVIGQGWGLVATDYVGLGTAGSHPYLIGNDEARSVLDAIRAAQQLTDAKLAKKTAVWGHSQGGGAALWTGQVAPTYAPELDIAGVAALAPASDLVGLMDNLPNVTGGSIFASYVVQGYTNTYPDVKARDYLRAGAQTIVPALASRCLSEPGVLVSVLEALSLSKDPEIFSTDPTTGAFGARLRVNVPTGTVPAPLLIAQGDADSLVLPRVQRAYVAKRCAAGQVVDYRVYPNRDHVPLVQADSPLIPELISWTSDRFAGDPAPTSCRISTVR
jgi:uncharacterized membrane protein HdeD (DUF308 family)